MVHIVSSINSTYIQHFCAMVMSVVQNSNAKIHFHIINNDLTEKDIIFIREVFSNFKNIRFTSYTISNHLLDDIEIQAEHLTIQTLFRLLIPKLLPDTIEKVIYLDSDIIVEKDISELYEEDIENHYIGAVNEMFMPSVNILNLSSPLDYFNAGVIILNLKKWRKHNFSERCLNYARNNQEKLLLADQDILNGMLRGEWKRLSLGWNVVKDIWDNYERYCEQYSEKQMEAVTRNPSIIHYTSPSKPWHWLCNHQYKERYFYYLNMTGIEYIKYPEYQYISQKNNIYIFGSGSFGMEVFTIFKENNMNVKGFYDNDDKKWGTKILDYEIYSLENHSLGSNDFIVIASMYHKEITQQLTDFGLEEFKDFCRIEQLYKLPV